MVEYACVLKPIGSSRTSLFAIAEALLNEALNT